MPVQPVDKIWIDGKLIDWEDARVHVLTHALHYGSGVFEGIRAYETERGAAVFRLTDHIDRLFRSAQIYSIDIPFSKEEIIEGSKELLRANHMKSSYVRPLVWHGYGEMGLNPLKAPVNVAVMTWEWGTYLGEECMTNGARVEVSSWRKHDPNIIPPGAKATGQYINSGLAKVQAVKSGYDDAIMLSHDGYVADGTGENLFVVRDGVLMTPPESCGILLGFTRDTVITLARDLGYEVIERELVRSDLYTADEVFYTGTAAEVTPIREIDQRPIGSGTRGPVAKDMQDAYFAAVKGQTEKYDAWCEYVD
ncbi:MAG TPA: branched-chain amino acid transaminase [Actinomycetota bacterium]|jgi:branched-chain amino acid aminotransferase|nr:branched-chain amino acid transaminase [Actinomycetota bacterium]